MPVCSVYLSHTGGEEGIHFATYKLNNKVINEKNTLKGRSRGGSLSLSLTGHLDLLKTKHFFQRVVIVKYGRWFQSYQWLYRKPILIRTGS